MSFNLRVQQFSAVSFFLLFSVCLRKAQLCIGAEKSTLSHFRVYSQYNGLVENWIFFEIFPAFSLLDLKESP